MIESKVVWALVGALGLAVFACAGLQPTRIAAGELLYEIPRPNQITDSDFGASIAVSGTTAIIGTTGTNISFYDAYPGGAYLVDLKTGQPLFRLADAVGADDSPFWVAIDGNRAVACAEGLNEVGAAFVYDVTSGQRVLQLTPPNASKYERFGSSVAIRGNRVLVGAKGYDTSGFATLFDASTGSALSTLSPADSPKWAEFGSSVALDGSYALVGAPMDPSAGSESGSAYLFDLNTGQQLRKLTAPDAAAVVHFGTAVAIEGNRAVVAADQGSTLGGGVYVFDITTGQLVNHIIDPGPPIIVDGPYRYPRFGTTIAFHGSQLLVGAPDTSDVLENAGAAYLYDIDTGELLFTYRGSHPDTYDFFGYEVAMNDQFVLLGNTREHGPGSVFVFSPVPEPPAYLLFVTFSVAFLGRRQS